MIGVVVIAASVASFYINHQTGLNNSFPVRPSATHMAELDEITDLLQRNEVAVWEANRVARPEIELASDRLTYLNFFSLTLNTDQWFEKILSTDFYR